LVLIEIEEPRRAAQVLALAELTAGDRAGEQAAFAALAAIEHVGLQIEGLVDLAIAVIVDAIAGLDAAIGDAADPLIDAAGHVGNAAIADFDQGKRILLTTERAERDDQQTATV
jgi:hypothetical protein